MHRPLLLLDVDGVIGDFATRVLDLARKFVPHEHTVKDIRTWEIFDSFPDLATYKRQVYEMMRGPGGCYSIPVAEGAKEGVARLRELADVHVVTSPFPSSATWMGEREAWLRDHFGFTHDDITHTHRKSILDGDVLVDDKAANVEGWLHHPSTRRLHSTMERVAVLWNQPHNSMDKTRALRTNSWEELALWVKEIRDDKP
jgi:5'(3')-deoxyribonucleotidase